MNGNVKTTQKERKYASNSSHRPFMFLVDLFIDKMNFEVTNIYRKMMEVEVTSEASIQITPGRPVQMKTIFEETKKERLVKSRENWY